MDSLDIEIYDLVIIRLGLEGVVEKVAENGGGKEGLGSGPAGDVECAARVSAGRGGVGDVVRAEGVNDDAAADNLRGVHAGFGKDEKALTADGAADARGELRLLTYVHGGPAFGQMTPRWDCYFGRDIMTTLEMSLGGLEGPARSVFRENFGDPVQPGSRKRSNGCAELVLSPPCSREWWSRSSPRTMERMVARSEGELSSQ
jgi:hypothetical protein